MNEIVDVKCVLDANKNCNTCVGVWVSGGVRLVCHGAAMLLQGCVHASCITSMLFA